MDKEYLVNYERKEQEQWDKLIVRKIEAGTFSKEKDRYPPKERFINLQKPIANTTLRSQTNGRFWAQVPFCGSLMFAVPAIQKRDFEKYYLKVKDIPDLIDFVKETGRIQTVLLDPPTEYIGLDHLDPFFKELNPPVPYTLPLSFFLDQKEILRAKMSFKTLAKPNYLPFMAAVAKRTSSQFVGGAIVKNVYTYSLLKKFEPLVARYIEDNLIENPAKANVLIGTASHLLVSPRTYLIGGQTNLTMDDIRLKELFKHEIKLEEIKFPYEIGSFLMKKMTLAPQNSTACYDIIYHYKKYDLENVQKALNDAITAKNQDLVLDNTKAISEILDNVWQDKMMEHAITGLKCCIEIGVGVVGLAVAATQGLLAGLGVEVMEKAADYAVGGLAERIAKWAAHPYQTTIYDFQKKYNPPTK